MNYIGLISSSIGACVVIAMTSAGFNLRHMITVVESKAYSSRVFPECEMKRKWEYWMLEDNFLRLKEAKLALE